MPCFCARLRHHSRMANATNTSNIAHMQPTISHCDQESPYRQRWHSSRDSIAGPYSSYAQTSSANWSAGVRPHALRTSCLACVRGRAWCAAGARVENGAATHSGAQQERMQEAEHTHEVAQTTHLPRRRVPTSYDRINEGVTSCGSRLIGLEVWRNVFPHGCPEPNAVRLCLRIHRAD